MLDLSRFEESPHLLDILLQMEDVLDSLDLYVFKNWFTGEIVDGPVVHRYWLTFTLRFPLKKMPDPQGAKRLLRQGILTKFEKVTLSDKEGKGDPVDPAKNEDAEESEGADKPTHFEVTIRIPRRLVSDMNAAELDFYDDDIDVEDVQDAQDSGMTDETAFQSDSQQAEPGEGDDDAQGGAQDAIDF